MKSKLLFPFLLLGFFMVEPLCAESATTAAQVGTRTITLEELDEAAKDSVAQIEMQIYDAKRSALNQLVEKRLLELEAQAQGVSVVALEDKIKSGISPVTEESVTAYYEKNKARIQEPITEVKGKITDFLRSQAENMARQKALREYRTKYPVKVFIKAPRVNVTAPEDAISRGPEDAPVQIIFFTDFQCPFCKRGADVLTQVLQNYPGKVRIIYQDYPLSFHENAPGAANAARCAAEQNQFWAYHDVLFLNQGALDKESLKKYAAGLALDTAKFNVCLDSNRHQAVVEQALANGKRYGVQGTPGFFINGRPIRGALPYESFKEIIDEELANSG